jgi:hypothetical protein
MEGPAPHRECESDYVCVVENPPSKELKAAQATRLRFYRDKEHSVTADLAQASEHSDHQLYVVSKILGLRYNEQDMFHELLVAWREFPVGKGHLGTVLCYGCGWSRDGDDVRGVSR